MEQDDYFDMFFEGTSVQRSIEVQSVGLNTLVVDKQDTYGTSVELGNLKESVYIKELRIRKSTSLPVLVECIPGLFQNIKNGFRMVEFVEIKSHFYYSEDLVRFTIPYNPSQVVDSKFMSMTDKRYLMKASRREIDVEKAVECFSSEFKEVLSGAFFCAGKTEQSLVNDYVESFGRVPFLYPRYGHKDISEAISRLNALRDIKYYISKNIRVENTDKGKYKYLIRSEYGNLYASYYSKVEDKKDTCFRVVLRKEVFIQETFLATFRLAKKIWCVGIDGSADVCPQEHYLFYFWAEDGNEVSNETLEKIGFDTHSLEMDISFRGIYSPVSTLDIT